MDPIQEIFILPPVEVKATGAEEYVLGDVVYREAPLESGDETMEEVKDVSQWKMAKNVDNKEALAEIITDSLPLLPLGYIKKEAKNVDNKEALAEIITDSLPLLPLGYIKKEEPDFVDDKNFLMKMVDDYNNAGFPKQSNLEEGENIKVDIKKEAVESRITEDVKPRFMLVHQNVDECILPDLPDFTVKKFEEIQNSFPDTSEAIEIVSSYNTVQFDSNVVLKCNKHKNKLRKSNIGKKDEHLEIDKCVPTKKKGSQKKQSPRKRKFSKEKCMKNSDDKQRRKFKSLAKHNSLNESKNFGSDYLNKIASSKHKTSKQRKGSKSKEKPQQTNITNYSDTGESPAIVTGTVSNNTDNTPVQTGDDVEYSSDDNREDTGESPAIVTGTVSNNTDNTPVQTGDEVEYSSDDNREDRDISERHTDSILCQCSRCRHTFLSIGVKKTKSMKLFENSCNLCFKSFQTVLQLQEHNKSKCDTLKPYNCHICCKEYILSSSLKNHIRKKHSTHVEQRYFKCEDCNKVYRANKNLNRHKKMMHLKYVTTSQTCDECSKVYPSSRSLQDHKRKYHRYNHVECEHCGKVFDYRFKLLNHIRANHTVKQFECDKCKSSFHTEKLLNKHKLTRHFPSGELNICEICGKGLATPVTLKKHLLIHKEEKPFICEACGKSFRTESNLAQHAVTHSDKRPFTCDLCEKSFRIRHHLRQHMAVHGMVNTSTQRKRKTRRISITSSDNDD